MENSEIERFVHGRLFDVAGSGLAEAPGVPFGTYPRPLLGNRYGSRGGDSVFEIRHPRSRYGFEGANDRNFQRAPGSSGTLRPGERVHRLRGVREVGSRERSKYDGCRLVHSVRGNELGCRRNEGIAVTAHAPVQDLRGRAGEGFGRIVQVSGFAKLPVFVEVGDAEFELQSARIVSGRKFYLDRAARGNDVPIAIVFAIAKPGCGNDRPAAYGGKLVSRTGEASRGAAGFGAGEASREARKREFRRAGGFVVSDVAVLDALYVFRRGHELVDQIDPHQDDEDGEEHCQEDGEPLSV